MTAKTKDNRDFVIRVNLNPEQFKLFHKLAEAKMLPVASYCRMRLAEIAQAEPK